MDGNGKTNHNDRKLRGRHLRLKENCVPANLSANISGQEKAKETLGIYIEAAKARGETLDHVLFTGLRDLEKQRLPELLRMKWVYT